MFLWLLDLILLKPLILTSPLSWVLFKDTSVNLYSSYLKLGHLHCNWYNLDIIIYFTLLKLYPLQLFKQIHFFVCILSHSVVSNSATIQTAAHRLFCPWDSPGKSTGVDFYFLLQGIFLTQGSNPHLLGLLRCRWILYHWATWLGCLLIIHSFRYGIWVEIQRNQTIKPVSSQSYPWGAEKQFYIWNFTSSECSLNI